MATIKNGKSAQPQDNRLLTQIIILDATQELTLKLWNTDLERMETITFTKEETERIDYNLAQAEARRVNQKLE